jgi:hypothetical protein
MNEVWSDNFRLILAPSELAGLCSLTRFGFSSNERCSTLTFQTSSIYPSMAAPTEQKKNAAPAWWKTVRPFLIGGGAGSA